MSTWIPYHEQLLFHCLLHQAIYAVFLQLPRGAQCFPAACLAVCAYSLHREVHLTIPTWCVVSGALMSYRFLLLLLLWDQCGGHWWLLCYLGQVVGAAVDQASKRHTARWPHPRLCVSCLLLLLLLLVVYVLLCCSSPQKLLLFWIHMVHTLEQIILAFAGLKHAISCYAVRWAELRFVGELGLQPAAGLHPCGWPHAGAGLWSGSEVEVHRFRACCLTSHLMQQL